jgi:hypothetical protein
MTSSLIPQKAVTRLGGTALLKIAKVRQTAIGNALALNHQGNETYRRGPRRALNQTDDD